MLLWILAWLSHSPKQVWEEKKKKVWKAAIKVIINNTCTSFKNQPCGSSNSQLPDSEAIQWRSDHVIICFLDITCHTLSLSRVNQRRWIIWASGALHLVSGWPEDTDSLWFRSSSHYSHAYVFLNSDVVLHICFCTSFSLPLLFFQHCDWLKCSPCLEWYRHLLLWHVRYINGGGFRALMWAGIVLITPLVWTGMFL